MCVLRTFLRLETQIVDVRPCCEALLLEDLLEVSLATADALEYLQSFLKLETILMREILDLLDEPLILALLVGLLRGCSLVGKTRALAVLLEESLLNRVILDCDVYFYDFKVKLLRDHFFVVLGPIDWFRVEFAKSF